MAKPKSQHVQFPDKHIGRRMSINAYTTGEDFKHVMWDDIDERRAYARDVVHEIQRDGCVRGERS